MFGHHLESFVKTMKIHQSMIDIGLSFEIKYIVHGTHCHALIYIDYSPKSNISV